MFENVKNDFPVFDKNPELIFLDTAASALKPKSVIERINNCYSYEYTNVHRGVYKLSTDLRPIQTSSWIKIKLLSLFFISAFTSVVIAIFLPPSGNYIFELKSLLFLSINLIPILLILFGIKFIHHLYDFGQTEKKRTKKKCN